MNIVMGRGEWMVKAEWMGATRTVFTGSLFACIRFVADNKYSGKLT